MRTPAAAAVIALISAMPAVAQTGQPLSGPAVNQQGGSASLVERDFSGKLKRLETPPEEAALQLLGLDQQARVKTDAILAARAEILDKMVEDNIDLVVRFANARQAGDRAEQLTLLGTLNEKLQPLNARGKLGDELRGALPADKTREYDALIADYRRAAVDEDVAEGQARGERVSRLQANLRENLVSLGLQIRRSYERTISAKSADFEQLLGQLSLRPEQDTKIRGMVTEYVQETKGKATPDQRRALFFRIMSQLDSDQQKTLMTAYIGRPGTG